MHQLRGNWVLVLMALVFTPGLPARAQTPAAARTVAYEPTAHMTAEHVQTGSPQFQVKTVSARNDMVSGGDVLVRISGSTGVLLEGVAVTLNGQPVTSAFRQEPGKRSLLGLVTGLRVGDNTVAVTGPAGSGRSTSLIVTNWPIEGPIFSGPHQQPYACMTQAFKLPVTGGTLGPALDKHCSIRTRVDYVYHTGKEFKPLPDPSARPEDMAKTTTNEGRTVAYIVRVETGTIDRAIYQIAMLHDPVTDRPVDPWNRPAGWNGRLVYTFGGGCPGGWFIQGDNTAGVLADPVLSLGYAMASSSLNVFGNNCDDVLSGESTMMVKEHFIESHGPPAYVIGWGSSGGSDQQHQIGDAYPGLLDGILPSASFPDIPFAHMTTHSWGARLLYNYFQNNASESWTKDQQVAVSGFALYETLVQQGNRPDRINPRVRVAAAGQPVNTGVCDASVPVAMLYDPDRNPRGARCSLYDHGAQAFGRDPATGFALRPLDNVGVQYGLQTLNDGRISKAQFLELNEKIGGVDIDANLTRERTTGDRAAIRRGYETGRFLSGGGGLASMPIIDIRAYADSNPGDPHMRIYGFMTRERLRKANGHIDNHVMFAGSRGTAGFESPLGRDALRQMDQWLANLAKDTSSAPRAVKVVRARPADLKDMCITPDGRRVVEPQTYDGPGECNKYFKAHGTAYTVAGLPLTYDIVACQRKPITPSDYKVQFTPAELERLRRIFPEGVCDYTKPGFEQRPLMGTWLTFGPAGVQRKATDN